MKKAKQNLPFVARLAALGLLPMVLFLPRTTAVADSPSSFLLFSVEASEHFTAIDPVACIGRGGAILPPFSPESDTESRRFVQTWLRPGITYRILFGGNAAGTATVRESPGDPGISLQTPCTLRTAAPLRAKTMALATSRDRVSAAKSLQRRNLTVGERAALLRAVQSTFRKQGISSKQAQSAMIVTSASLNLDRRGRPEIVARVQAGPKNAPNTDLFLIAEPVGATDYGIAFTVPHKNNGTGEDLNYVEQDFVDALDLDGDGIAEVVTRSVYYESHDYAVYKKRRGGNWRGVYRGAGGGV